MIGHVLIRLDRSVSNEDSNHEYLKGIQTDDALESKELEHNLVWCELIFLGFVEAKTGEDGENGGSHLDNLKPDVRESRAVGGAAVGADGEGDGGGDPDDNGDGKVLENHVPGPLRVLSVACRMILAGKEYPGRTLSHGGLSTPSLAILEAPWPNSSSKPPGFDMMKSHSNSRNAEMAIEHPKSRDSIKYSPTFSCQTIRNANNATHGTSIRIRITCRCWIGFE